MEEKFMDSEFGNVDAACVPSLVFQKYSAKPLAHLKFGIMALKCVKNFWDVPLFLLGRARTLKLAFRDGASAELDKAQFKDVARTLLSIKSGGHKAEWGNDFSEIRFPFEGRNVVLEGSRGNALFLAYHLFLAGHEYPPIDVRGKAVVDVGANIGDTAVYFALKGAKRVVAFEPFAGLCETARKNVERNRLSGSVVVEQAPVGARTETVLMEKSGEGGAGKLEESRSGEKVEVVGLSDLAEKYGVADGVLKIDCEGAEYGIILGSGTETLRRFETIILEYHYGYLNLKEKLESAGFKVRLPKPPGYDRNMSWAHPCLRIGILVAERQG